MNGAEVFIEWIIERFEYERVFRPLRRGELPYIENFDLSYELSGSLIKGKQWFFFKILPQDLTQEDIRRFASERNQIVRAKSKFWKLLQEFLVFFYIADHAVSSEVLGTLANFYTVKKRILGNVHEINIYFDASSGNYVLPKKTGLFGWQPLKKLFKETRLTIFESYLAWIQKGSNI